MDRRDALKSSGLIIGGLLSTSTLGLLQGCTTPDELGWQPQFFTEEEARVLANLAEVIIPATETPGAKEAGVARFIDSVVNTVFTSEEQVKFKSGFDQFSQAVLSKYGKALDALQPKEQYEATVALLGENKEFEATLKLLVIRGFFKSEPGATRALEFIDIPGRYDGCITIEPDQKGYAT